MGKSKALIFSIILPIFFLIIISLVVLLTKFIVHPKYDFLYTDQNQLRRNIVVDGRLTQEVDPTLPDSEHWNQFGKIYLYDIERDKSYELTLEQAQQYKLDLSITSPDGFEIINFGNSIQTRFDFNRSNVDSGNMYLNGKGLTKKLGLENKIYSQSFKFLGWVIK